MPWCSYCLFWFHAWMPGACGTIQGKANPAKNREDMHVYVQQRSGVDTLSKIPWLLQRRLWLSKRRLCGR